MKVVYQGTRPGRIPSWTVERTIRHVGDDVYESEVKEITPANPQGHIRGGKPSRFTLVDGVARWVSNGSVIRDDVIRDHGIDQLLDFDISKHEAAYDAYLEDTLSKYREAQFAAGPPSGEELAEMRSAFGLGATVVDVITGRRTKL